MFRAVILAAGKSKRMGETDKLMMPLGDKHLIEHAIEPLTKIAQVKTVLVCSSPQVADLGIKWGIEVSYSLEIHNQSQSLITGLSLMTEENTKGIIFVLGDQPFVPPKLYEQMISAYQYLTEVGSTRNMVIPYTRRASGNPVLLSSCYLPHLKQLRGDEGARSIIRGNPYKQFRIEAPSRWSMLDIDNIDDYTKALRIYGRRELFHEAF